MNMYIYINILLANELLSFSRAYTCPRDFFVPDTYYTYRIPSLGAHSPVCVCVCVLTVPSSLHEDPIYYVYLCRKYTVMCHRARSSYLGQN